MVLSGLCMSEAEKSTPQTQHRARRERANQSVHDVSPACLTHPSTRNIFPLGYYARKDCVVALGKTREMGNGDLGRGRRKRARLESPGAAETCAGVTEL